MTDQHPITPPLELVNKWGKMLEYCEETDVFSDIARWGADQELEACCEWLNHNCPNVGSHHLTAARRPKPQSLKEQALEALYQIESECPIGSFGETIRRALEQLGD